MTAPMMRVEHRQNQTLTPRLQQAVRLLQLSSLDFAQEIRDAMGKNPFLEHEDPAEAPPEEPSAEAGATLPLASMAAVIDPVPVTPMEAAEVANEASNAPDIEDSTWERDTWQEGSQNTRQHSGEGETSVLDMVASDVGLRPHLHAQARLRALSERDRALVGCIIESLDDDGYLRTDLQELADLFEMEPAVELSEMQTALSLVQSLEPAGVGARNIAECLLLQLHLIEDARQREMAREIISHHLDRLVHRDCTALAKLLERDVHDVEAVCDRIRHMAPRPGWCQGSADVQYVTPDVIVRKIRGQWTAVLNQAIVPRVKLNQFYADLFKRHREGQHSEMAAHLQEARWTIRNVEQRFSTILSVAQAILRRQHHFLEFGPMAMKPLGLKEIAEEVGLHESTVSRVTNNKYMATPAGVFELKYFFSRAMPTQSGGACSATAIRGLIKDMINGESDINPLSDAEIARQLARQGLTVARRTVTKYRQLLKIAPVEQRRRNA